MRKNINEDKNMNENKNMEIFKKGDIYIDYGNDNLNNYNEYPKIYVYHMYYGSLKKSELSEISKNTFDELKETIVEKFKIVIKNLKKKQSNNSYLYSKLIQNLKNEINNLSFNNNVLQAKYNDLLNVNRNIMTSNRELYQLMITNKKENKELLQIVRKLSDAINVKNENYMLLFNNIPNKKEFLSKNNKSEIANIVCGVCFKHCKNEKSKCIHPGCIGFCNECSEKHNRENESKCFDMCPSCNKKREIQCPICLEICNENMVFKNPSKKCQHSICYSCFTQSFFEAKKPIKKCPLCRESFIKS